MVRWGMIGAGDVTEVKSGPALYKAQHSELVAVTNRTLAKAESWVARHGHGQVRESVDALLADPEVDIVYIATPPGDHLALAKRAAAAGKHVYVEKPMALDAVECDEMIAACAAAGVRLFVAYYRRSLPRFVQVKRWLEEEAIGTVCAVSLVHDMRASADELDGGTLPWRLRAGESGGGKFMDMAVHALDVIDYWLGPCTEVSGHASNRGGLYEVEDTVSATWRHADGVVGTGSWCFVAGVERDAIAIIGTRGRIELECFGSSIVRLTTEAGVTELDLPNPPHVQQPFIQSIVDELRGEGLCPGSAESAARTSRVADAVLRSRHA